MKSPTAKTRPAVREDWDEELADEEGAPKEMAAAFVPS